MRAVATLVALALVVLTERATAGAAPMPRMLALIAATFLAAKLLVGAAAPLPLPWPHHLAWLAHFGMDQRAFAERRPRTGITSLVRTGAGALAVGIVLLAIARVLPLPRLVTVVLVFAGASAAVHFGVFDLVTAWHRARGFAAERLFRAPWRAVTLADFWGRRWNLGFVEMTAILVYRPLAPRVGGTTARAAAFLFSGGLHELAITVPVGAGHGRPTLYFAIQAVCLTLERRFGWRGRLHTFAILAAPLPLLFPSPFVDAIVAPLAWARP